MTDNPIIEALQDNKLINDIQLQSIISNNINDDDTINKHFKSLLSIHNDLNQIDITFNDNIDFIDLKNIITKRYIINNSSIKTNIVNTQIEDMSFKTTALNCLNMIDKLSIKISNNNNDLNQIRSYIYSITNQFTEINLVLTDSITYLLQLWLFIIKKLKFIRIKFDYFLMLSELSILIIELDSLLYQFTNTNSNSTHLNTKQIIKTINSYILIIKEVFQNLNQIQINLNNNNDIEKFNECYQIYLDIESSYITLCFNWLLTEIKSLNKINNTNNDINSLLLSSNSIPIKTIEDKEEIVKENNELSPSPAPHSSTITKELPFLLAAFQNAKKLEQQVETIRANNNESIINDKHFKTNINTSILNNNNNMFSHNNNYHATSNLLNNLNNFTPK